ncbi:DUF397 domain-containing protein [Actinomadura sp. BRA 177]|uniref:DUF397 domain-containing protein n=1 Tax=Actinomadura sp. BRA 177 TaxID=2745202 RepID=UPI00159591E4|nr:DUF397 domain-containing protein [Actinomadura sp. BRA 177]NVI91959.1 DUF397 domain-containing protein [Actinomadura sp. BRA 177]
MIVWRKASRSNTSGGDCVEVAQRPGNIGVRDSKDPLGPAFALSRETFRSLVHAAKAGNLDAP